MATLEILPRLRLPEDVHKLTMHQLQLLCDEIRTVLIDTVSRTGGHLASNLGVVELTVALYRVFSFPQDRLVWDVGHQCYTHKLLSGRLGEFSTLRQQNGLSGFPKTAESPFDSFIAGHASTSLAVASGLRAAKGLEDQPGEVIAVIGDGALTGGMAFEGINNIGRGRGKVIVILNDNQMSISKNVGAVARYLSVIRSKPGYFKFKDAASRTLKAVPVVGSRLERLVSHSKDAVKQMIYRSNFFEEFGLAYMGPVDGHNLEALCDLFERAKQLDYSVLIHVSTVKGKGYPLAEQNPGVYHGVSSFEPAVGCKESGKQSFSQVFGQELVRLARQDERICAITAAMADGTGLAGFARQFGPAGRFFDVGIAEQFAVTFGAALEAGGRLPVFAVYSSFLQRAYDQLLHDAAIERRHLVLGIDRAGIVGEDGETHQGLFDVAFLSTIPGVTLYAPGSFRAVGTRLAQLVEQGQGICALRYPRGGQWGPDLLNGGPADFALQTFGPAPHRKLLVTYGRLTAPALRAAQRLGQEGMGVALLQLERLLPLVPQAVQLAAGYGEVYFAEEGIEAGGLGQQFGFALLQRGYQGCYRLRAVPGFVPQATVEQALCSLGLDEQGLYTWLQQGE